MNFISAGRVAASNDPGGPKMGQYSQRVHRLAENPWRKHGASTNIRTFKGERGKIPMDRGQRAASKKVTIHWEGRPVEACAGDNVASALFAAGVHVLGRSRKFHRPVGLSGSFLAGVKGQVDGLPNQRLDQIPVRPGLAARAQNVWPNGRFDLLRLAGLIPRQWLRGGFEHPVWLPGGS
jgi:hypothetical protein